MELSESETRIELDCNLESDRSAMGRKSSVKGSTGEREFLTRLGKIVGCTGILSRNLEQRRSGGEDARVNANFQPANDYERRLVSTLNTLSIEIKRHASCNSSSINRWWQQAVTQARQHNPPRIPMLAFRPDRGRWQCLLHVSSELPRSNMLGCLRMDIELMAEFLRANLLPSSLEKRP